MTVPAPTLARLPTRFDPVALAERAAARASRRSELLEQRDAIDQQLRQLEADDLDDRELDDDALAALREADRDAVVEVMARPAQGSACPHFGATLRLRHYAPADLARWRRAGLRLGIPLAT